MVKDYTKILFISMIITGILLVILPEYRGFLIYLLIAQKVGWWYYSKPNWNKVNAENKRIIKYFIVPTMLVDLALIFIYTEFSSAGIIFLFFTAFALLMYMTPDLQDSLIGINKVPTVGLLAGIGIPLFFILLSQFNRSFSLLTPALPSSIATQIRAVIVMGIAPITEEIIFRGAILNGLQKKYNLKFWEANGIQSTLFGLTHMVAYGILLATFDKWKEVFVAFTSLSGAFIAAIAFGLIAGYIVEKSKKWSKDGKGNLLPGMIMHAVINGFLIVTGLVIVLSIVPFSNMVPAFYGILLAVGVSLMIMIIIYIVYKEVVCNKKQSNI